MISIRLPPAMEKQIIAKLQSSLLGSAPSSSKRPTPRRPVAVGPAALSEDAIHRSCIEWADVNTRRLPALQWLMHPANGGKRPRGEAGKLKAMGMKKGVHDLLLFWPCGVFSGLAVEMKRWDGKLSSEQRDWTNHFLSIGWRVEICRSLDEFVAVIEGYLDPG